jgi:hypothetical protein
VAPLRVRLALVVWDALWLKMAAQAEAEPGRQACHHDMAGHQR